MIDVKMQPPGYAFIRSGLIGELAYTHNLKIWMQSKCERVREWVGCGAAVAGATVLLTHSITLSAVQCSSAVE
jgi:hypothetical protein